MAAAAGGTPRPVATGRPAPRPGGGPAEGAARRFWQRFGAAPEGIWQAPGRANLIGEHTDYNDGFVLPFAIGASVCVAAARRTDGLVVLSSCQEGDDEVTIGLDELAPGSVGGWAAYPAGVAWALRGAGYPVAGASLAIDADLAPGAGLSSSAALECAAALALTELYQLPAGRPELAALTSRAENDFVGAPTGIMDQSAVLLCQAGHALLLDCRSGTGTQVPLDPPRAGLAVVIIDTRARHELTGGQYGARRRACQDAARALGVPSLREITDPSELAGLTGPLLRRARHVVTENRRVLQLAELLRSGGLGSAGPLLTASHASLRDDFEVTWPEADAAVETALAAGAHGARMTGGGFGGSVIALLSRERVAAVTRAVASEFGGRGWPEPSFAEVVPARSARRLR